MKRLLIALACLGLAILPVQGTFADTGRVAQCADGGDNDNDGLIDFDKNGDGVRDIDADPGCQNSQENREAQQPMPIPLCPGNADPRCAV